MSKARMGNILFKLGAIPLGCLGAALTLGGCCLGTGWLVALARGASAAELPDPIAITYPIWMLLAGVTSLLLSGLLLAVSRWLQRS